MHVGAGAEEAIAPAVVGAGREALVVHRLQVQGGIAQLQSVAPQHVGDAVVGTGPADRQLRGGLQVGVDRCIAADRPEVLAPVGIGLQPAPLLRAGRLPAGEGQRGAGIGQQPLELGKAVAQGDVGIGQQHDRLLAGGGQAQPVGEAQPPCQGPDLHRHGAVRGWWRPRFHPHHRGGQGGMAQVVGQAVVDLRLALRSAGPEPLQAKNDAHGRFTGPATLAIARILPNVCRWIATLPRIPAARIAPSRCPPAAPGCPPRS